MTVTDYETMLDKVEEDIVLHGQDGAEERARQIIRRIVIEDIRRNLGDEVAALVEEQEPIVASVAGETK